MAQTRRKRRTKHRGTPAGTIETRGRTGRPPTAAERKKQDRVGARERRLNTPPTWKSSATRAVIAAGLVFIFLLVTAKGKNKLAIALHYERGTNAPVVVAKGKGSIGEKIVEIAKANDIPIEENEILAGALSRRRSSMCSASPSTT